VTSAGSRKISQRALNAVVTTACNLDCTYCYQNVRNGSGMDWGTLRTALHVLLQSEERQASVNFYGGEPLLSFPLIKKAVQYLEAEKPAGKGVDFSISTNGLLLDGEGARFLACHGFETQISFDGIAEAQERRATGTFEKLDRLLLELRESNERFFTESCSISITLSSGNISYLAKSFAYFLDRGVREVAVSPLVTHDAGWRPELIDVLVEEVAAVLSFSLEHFGRTGEIPFVPFRTDDDGEPAEAGPPAMCSAGKTDELAVDVDGEVFPCVMLVNSYQTIPDGTLAASLKNVRLGKIRDPEFDRRLAEHPANVRAARIFDNKQSKFSSYRKCEGCKYVRQCSICPVSICHIPGNDDPNRVPDLPCALNLVLLAARERFLENTRASGFLS